MEFSDSEPVRPDEGEQWGSIYRSLAEIMNLLAWAELAVSPGDAAETRIAREQASAIALCIRRARTRLREIHDCLQHRSESEGDGPDRRGLASGP